MPHRQGVRIALYMALFVTGIGGCNKGFNGPSEEQEVKKSTIKVDLPKVEQGDFTLAAPPGDGSHTVRELRVKGKKLVDTEITVKGVVTWAYDCATDIRKPNQTDAEVAKEIEEDQTKCQRPKFYVGDDANTAPEKSLWIVDVPRPFTKLETKNGGKEELKNPPPDRCISSTDPKKATCPVYKVGDKVTITGKFSLASNHSERNSDGLVIYKKMVNETQNYTSPEPAPPPAGGPAGKPGAAGGPPAKPSPEDIVNKKKAG